MMNSETENIERLIKDKGVQFRDFRTGSVELRRSDDGRELTLEGMPCAFNEETVLYSGDGYELREIIEPGAFDGADMSDVIFNYNHCGRVYARTRNKTLELSADGEGLHMRAHLMSDDDGHKSLYRDIESGLIDKMSFAFTVEDQEFVTRKTDGGTMCELRRIKKFRKIYDVSAVDIPAYNTTEISARHAFEAESRRRNAESRKRALDIIKIKLKMEETR